MAFLLKTATKVRNNWKKSTFAALVLAYGYNWTKEYMQTQELMRKYCEEASRFGRQIIPGNKVPRTVTVILNPNANKRSAVDEFEKYCAPIFHLAGFLVNVVKTESEGHARKLVLELNNTDAIIVAGGDGTLCEVVTGLLRRTGETNTGLVPIGVLPLGRNNTFAKSLFPNGHHLQKVKSLVDASMAVVEESTKFIDVMKIEISEDDNSKPIYALSNLKWGAYRDAEVLKDKYWYYGSLRNYATYIFNGLKDSLTWKIRAEVVFSPPCEGCSNCTLNNENNTNKKWFQRFSRDKTQENMYARMLNPECSIKNQKNIETSDFVIHTSNISSGDNSIPRLHLTIGPKILSYVDFVSQGWGSEKGKQRKFDDQLDARVISIEPKETWTEDKGLWFSIDNDEFEVKPIKITLLPRLIPMFCKKENMQS